MLSCVMCIKQFSSLTKAVHGTASNTFAAGLKVVRGRLGCRDLSNKGTNDKHSLEEKFWHLAFTTSTVAPLQVARLGWLPRQKLPLHDGWQRNEVKKYATSHKMSYENRTKSGMTKIVLPGSWGCHHCENDRGPPQNDTLGKVGPRYRHCNTHRGRLYFGMSFHLVPNFVRNSIKTAELPQHKSGSPSEHWWIPSSQLQFISSLFVCVLHTQRPQFPGLM